ncbi:MAG: polyhydroxyalkanoic acid system family protein [Proteobacteria bacterium]|nr:polyhydroxyalkanoic acid system family protein [Pseudomonadota bacterium]
MSDIHVHRTHALGLAHARKLLCRWQPLAEDKLSMRCTLKDDGEVATLAFTRMGAQGTFRATARAFEIDCNLGLIFKPLRGQFQKLTEEYLDGAIAKEVAKVAAKGAP